MVDFDIFKKKMLDAKKGMVDNTSSQNDKDKAGEEAFQKEWDKDSFMNFTNIWKEDVTAKENGWKQKIGMKDYKNGYKCTLHQRKTPGNSVDTIRINAFMVGVTAEELVEYAFNLPPNKMIKETKILETYPNGDIILYTRMKIPLMSERVNCCRMS